MRFKTITAPTMREAMQTLRDSMGPDAIILNTQCGADGSVILRAALERRAEPGALPDDDMAQMANPFAFPMADPAQETEIIAEISDALNFHRVSEDLVARLTKTASAFSVNDAIAALTATFDGLFGFSPLACAPERPVMLIGPAGAGKTVTTVKLTARALLAGHDAMLITTDVTRTGASAQLRELTEIMGCTLHEASGPADLADLLAQRQPGSACFIDTPACSPFNLTELELVKSLIMAADVDPVLTLPAGGDAAEAAEIVHVFSGLGARGMIVTRLDTTRRLGSILSAMDSAAMTLHHVSVTPYIARGLAPISPGALAHIFMEDPFEQDTYQELERASQ